MPISVGDGSDLFHQLIDTAPDAMVVVGQNGTIELVNRQTEMLFGYGREELVGERIEVLVPERFRAGHVGHRSGYARDPKSRPMGSGLELFGRRKDGSEFPVEISLSPVEIKGRVLISSAIRDVSQRKASEAAARLASDRLLSAIESIHGMLALYDARDRLVLCNSAWREFFSYDAEGPIVGRSHAEIVDACLAAGLLDLGNEPPSAFRARCLEYHHNPVGVLDVRARGGQTLRLTERRTLEGGVVSTIWDISDDVEHEQELKKAHAIAEAASSAKSEFLSSMSHELRTPLNSILGFAQLLQRDKKAPLTESQKEKLDYVLKGGEHLLRLIDDILDLSRIEAGRVTVSPEPVNVQEVFEEVKTTLDPMAARAGIAFSFEPVPPEVSQVIADRTRFSQILINFGSNALKYGRKGGKAELSAAPTGVGFVRVTVADDGLGIPLDKQDKMFQPFHRAGQEAGPIEGTGIGLTITKRLAELMGGGVGFHSVPGQGSRFWIDLPAYEARRDATNVTQPVKMRPGALAAPEASYRIVYIEDNPSNIAFMQGIMEEVENVQLVCAPTAELGIDLIHSHRPDVVIMDINLPGMSGYEATRRLRESPETKHIPVIALSAAAMVHDRKRAEEAGFYRYLTKPVKVAELVQTLEELLVLHPPPER